MVKAHFINIHLEIIRLLDSAQSDIKICVAWFTDFDIYTKIVEKQISGVNVEVIVSNHEFNKRSKVNFKDLLKYNGIVGYIGNLNDGSKDKFMHNKFCIIDDQIIITGSYNWSYKARFNDENILVVKNESNLVKQFTDKFYDIKPEFGFAIKNNEVSLMPIEKIMAKWNKKPLQKKVKQSSSEISKSKITDKF
ncbi:phospholipase D-like domain-containing protein [Flavobacteriales bacterium]|nr:phospholipase D-like domain-containing protein [Flavobacteriales bacterium]